MYLSVTYRHTLSWHRNIVTLTCAEKIFNVGNILHECWCLFVMCHSATLYLFYAKWQQGQKMPAQSYQSPLERSWMWLAEERGEGMLLMASTPSLVAETPHTAYKKINMSSLLLICSHAKTKLNWHQQQDFCTLPASRGNVDQFLTAPTAQLSLVNSEKTKSSTAGMWPQVCFTTGGTCHCGNKHVL